VRSSVLVITGDPASIVWFQTDLRHTDNPALQAAITRGGGVIPLYIESFVEESPWAPGAASRWWLHQSLAALDESLQERGSRLIVRSGPALDVLPRFIHETGARAVYWNHRHEPAIVARNLRLRTSLGSEGIETQTFSGSVLFEPDSVRNSTGEPFKVFTPFWRACSSRQAQPDLPEDRTARRLTPPAVWPSSLSLEELALEPVVDWAGGLRRSWTPGERGARRRLDEFLVSALAEYPRQRNLPGVAGTSRLSPHLHFGEISARTVWHELRAAALAAGDRETQQAVEAWLRQLGWREFAWHILAHFPETAEQPMRPEFDAFPWRNNARRLKAWQSGCTGYPLVDAGMRELWTTGWMHNRVRMVVASFLTKDLMLPWQAGARWFWDTLVDADLANNAFGWQWTAGCGADAAPFFRVFNPTAQGERYDSEGDYIRRWVPELTRLSGAWIHKPWEAPASLLWEAGVKLGDNYPLPIVDHADARRRALAAYHDLRGSKTDRRMH